MRIEKNSDILNFIENCSYNMVHRMDLNEGIEINSYNEKKLIEKNQENDENVNYIYIDSNLILDNMYYKNINLEKVNKGNFEYSSEFMKKKVAINISWILPDKNRELNDYVILGASKKKHKDTNIEGK